jgi:hypothetical protein
MEKVIGDRVIIEVETNNVSGRGNKIANTFETDKSRDNCFERGVSLEMAKRGLILSCSSKNN